MEIGSIFLLLAVILLVGIYISRPLFMLPRRKTLDGAPDQKADESDYLVGQATGQDHLRSSLLAEYDRLLNAIQELEFDHTLGKIPAEDYPNQRAALLQAGADLLKKLDQIQATPVDPTVQGKLTLTGMAAMTCTPEERFVAAAQLKLSQDGHNLIESGTGAQVGAGMGGMPPGSQAPDSCSATVPAAVGVDGLENPQGTMDAESARPAATAAGRAKKGAGVTEIDEMEALIASRRRERSEKAAGFCPRCGKPVQKLDRFCPKCGTAL
jgi:hypothetical protein